MAELVIDRAWIATLTEDHLRRAFGNSTFERGVGYARAGRVEHLETGDHGRMLMASVRGTRSRPYHCLVIAAKQHPGDRPSTRCSCPVTTGCKHAVAVIEAVRAHVGDDSQGLGRTASGRVAAGADQPRRAPGEPAAPHPWEQVLSAVARQRPAPAPAAATPLALQVTVRAAQLPRHGYSSSPARVIPAHVAIHPVVRGSSGRWIKTGVSWRLLDARTPRVPLDPAQLAYATRIISLFRAGRSWQYTNVPDQIGLAELGSDVWPLLAGAEDAGIELITERPDNPAVRVGSASTELAVRLRRAPEEGLLLEPGTMWDGQWLPMPDVNLVGTPPHGWWRETGDGLDLAGFPQALDRGQHALAIEPLVVPPADVGHFLATYYPVLHQTVRLDVDDDVEVPEIEPPRLALDVTFEADNQVVLRWQFLYGGLGGTRLPVVATAEDPPVPVRDSGAEQKLVDSLLASPPIRTHMYGGHPHLVPVQRCHGLETIAVATELVPELTKRDDVVVTVHTEPPPYREADEAPRIELSISDATDAAGATDWFDLGVEVTIDGETVPFVPLFTALARGEDHLVLESGTWFRLDRPELEQLRRLIDEARLLDDGDGTSLRLSPVHAGLWGELVALGVVREQSQAWTRSAGALLELDPSQAAAVPAGVRAELRPYQVAGFQWLALLWQARLGGILADDMGLGKTLQMLSLAERARAAGDLGEAPLLVVAPTSVVPAWAAEAAKFAPELRVATVTQTSAKRGTPIARVAEGAHVVVTSYTLLRLEADDYAARAWAGLVLDEAQFVKNRHSKVYQAVRRVPAPVRFAITGTPLENNLMDLWSLLSVAAPGLFADPAVFTDLYRRPIEGGDAAQLARLQRRIRPLMLRRTKEQVAADLPPKQEQIVSVTLTPAHRRIYDTRLHRERQRVLQLIEDLDRNRMTILRSLTVLRQLSLAPALVDPAHAATRSSKIDVLMELVDDVVAGGHRALVFSQFTGFLRLVRDRLDSAGIGYAYLDGRTRDRERRIAQFREGDDPLFLISLKAGGFGLTLTEADYVFVLDPWWNPAAEAQAVDRAHRIGQDKHVNVYRLVAADTIEEKVVALQERKRDLFTRVVGEGGELSAPLSADDIRGLLED